MTTLTPNRLRHGVDRRIGLLMAFVAATLAAAAAIHLAGYTPAGAKPPFDATDAGIAEAIIGVVLACGGIAVLRASRHAWGVAVGTISFAIVGFVVGLTITARGGDVPDVAYHVTVLPILVAGLVILLKTGRSEVAAGRP